MFAFFFGSKKTRVIPQIHQSYINNTEVAKEYSGKAESYTFIPPIKDMKPKFNRLKYPITNDSTNKSQITDEIILNEANISRLIARYGNTKRRIFRKDHKKVGLIKEPNQDNVKHIRQTLNRTRKYKTTMMLDKRQGFASTLMDTAETIGINNTVKFLLRTISYELVSLN